MQFPVSTVYGYLSELNAGQVRGVERVGRFGIQDTKKRVADPAQQDAGDGAVFVRHVISRRVVVQKMRSPRNR